MDPIDSRERFTITADRYRRFRPSYPPALFDWIAEATGVRPPAPALDLACGTGISTRLLAARGYEVVGVDPNEEMLAQARQDGGARYQRGESEATGLAAGSVALVTVAQAFHWFRIEPTLRELARILTPAGRVVAYWNHRKRGPIEDAYEALLHMHSREYPHLQSAETSLAALGRAPRVIERQEASFDNSQRLDREGLFGRVYSSSYVAHGLDDKAAFDAALGALFDAHARGGFVEMRYDVRALAFAVGPA